MKKTILRSGGFSCPSCVEKIEKSLGKIPGVKEAKVHFTTGRIEVVHDEEQAKKDDLLKAVQAAGYEAKVSPF